MPNQLANVSRETNDRLVHYLNELGKWSARINLVAPSTIKDGWRRHVEDSAQLYQFLKPSDLELFDFGSGGGTPALILAILSLEQVEDRVFNLIESDQRKCVFLRKMAHELGLNVRVHTKRIETLEAASADVLTARAFAPLEKILDLALPRFGSELRYVLPKGARAEEEIDQARTRYSFELEITKSVTDPQGSVLNIWEVGKLDV